MKHPIHLALGAIALTAAGASQAAGGYAYISQTGTLDAASIDQTNTGGYWSGSIYQWGGSLNTAEIEQTGTAGSPTYGYASIGQWNTTSSEATVKQTGVVGNSWGYIDQTAGTALKATVAQNGTDASWGFVVQSGLNNTGSVEQWGAVNSTMWVNQGYPYYVGQYYTKTGFVDVDTSVATPPTENSTAMAWQYGIDNQGYILQYGSGLSAYFTQFGASNVGGILQTGPGHWASIYQGGLDGIATIYQKGSYNVAGITQYGGANDRADIYQYGVAGSAGITQIGSNWWAGINQGGFSNVASIYQH